MRLIRLPYLGYGKIVDCLIRSGAVVNMVNKEGNTPLFMAVKYGN